MSHLLSRRAWLISALLGTAFWISAGSASLAVDRESPQPLPTLQTLSGEWRLAVDPKNEGRAEGWQNAARPEAKAAPVPGVIQQVFPAYHGVAWYWHSFRPAVGGSADDRLWLRFGAVDYLADVWVNGRHAGAFEGGETPFEFEVTEFIHPGADNLVAVRVLNPTETPIDGVVLSQTPHRNKAVPPRSGSPFNSGGIMYPVELYRVPPVSIGDVFVQPDLASGNLKPEWCSSRSTGSAAR